MELQWTTISKYMYYRIIHCINPLLLLSLYHDVFIFRIVMYILLLTTYCILFNVGMQWLNGRGVELGHSLIACLIMIPATRS
jgi:hypothetical protein